MIKYTGNITANIHIYSSICEEVAKIKVTSTIFKLHINILY